MHVFHVFHSRDCSQQLRWCLTCRQHQLMRSHFILCSALSPQTLSTSSKDTKTCKKQHSNTEFVRTFSDQQKHLSDHQQKHWIQMEIWDKGEIKAMLARPKDKTTKAREQYCAAGHAQEAMCFGSRLWLGWLSDSLSGTRAATAQPCFPTTEAAMGITIFLTAYQAVLNTTPGCPQEHSLLFESTNLRYWQDTRNCKMSPPTFKNRKLQLREAKHQVWEAREGEKHSKLG